jgi:hypothetical protein
VLVLKTILEELQWFALFITILRLHINNILQIDAIIDVDNSYESKKNVIVMMEKIKAYKLTLIQEQYW